MAFKQPKTEGMVSFLKKLLAEVINSPFHNAGLAGFAKDLEAGGVKQEVILKVTGNAVTPTIAVIKNTLLGTDDAAAVPAIVRSAAGDYLLSFGATSEAAVLAADGNLDANVSISNVGTANIPCAQINGAGKVRILLFDAAAAATDTGVYYLRLEVHQ